MDSSPYSPVSPSTKTRTLNSNSNWKQRINYSLSVGCTTVNSHLLINLLIHLLYSCKKLQGDAKQPNLQDFEDHVQGFKFTD